MPTLPSQPPSFSGEPHRVRDMAESFGADPDRYDRARPGYPAELVAAILAASPGREVLDVGIGTGIAARQFAAAGARVLGVDVDARMADFARRGGLAVEVAAFEEWDPAGRAFDAVVAAQTWHWIDPAAGAVKAALVLRAGGLLAAIWNIFQPAPEVAAAFSAVYRRVTGAYDPWARDPLQAYSAIFARVADGIRACGLFGEPQQWRFDWQRSYTRDEWLEQLRTGGDVSRIPPAVLDQLITGVGAAIDALGGHLTMHYAAIAVTAARTATT